jgi:hypothetical protein
METLLTFYPNVADFLAADPADIAPIMLRFAKNQIQNDMFIPGSVNNIALGHEPIVPANKLSRPNQQAISRNMGMA